MPDDTPVLRSTRLPEASAAPPRSPTDAPARPLELREALDTLRATLEGRPPPASTPPVPLDTSETPAEPDAPGAAPGPPHRADPAGASEPADPADPVAPASPAPRRAGLATRRPALVAGGAAVLLGVVLGAVAVRSAGRPVSAAPAPSATVPAATASGPATPTASPAASPAAPPAASPTVTTAPLPWPGGAVLDPPGLPVAGPGASAPGLELTAALDPDGAHVDVYERLLLRPGVTALALSPADLGPLARSLRLPADPVTDLQVELDGVAVRPERVGAGWQVVPPGGATVARAVLRYRLSGALVRQEPAPPGRVTLVLRPLGAPTVLAARDAVVVRIDDARVGTLTCPTSRLHPLCGTAAGAAHVATVPADATAVVLAQVTRR